MMGMTHVFCAVLMLFVLTAPIRAQDLRSSWERIQAFFLGGLHDSVVVHTPPFLEELRKHDLKPQMSVGYFHYGVSLAHLGRDAESDSAFAQARALATLTGDTARAREIAMKQIQLYTGLAARPTTMLQQKIMYYEKALSVSAVADPKTRAWLHYQAGLARRENKDSSGAVRNFETALEIAEKLSEEQELFKALVSTLTELYLSAGMNAQAEMLAHRTGSGRARIEYTIRLAEAAESEARFAEADRLLSSVQSALMAEGDENRMIEFAKKRYSLHDRLGEPVRGYDTLRALLREIRPSSPAARFHVARFAALLAVQKGVLEEAGSLLAEMRSLGTDPSLAPFLHQTTGDIAYLQGDNARAIDSYRRALSSESAFDEPARFSLMNNLGLALTRNGEYTDGLRIFEDLYLRAISQPSLRVQADLNAGIVLMKMDSTSRAADRFWRAREAAIAEGNKALQVLASLRLAESHRRSGLETSSASLFAEVRREQEHLRDPFNRIQVLQALAEHAQSSGDHWSAVVLLRDAHRLARDAGAAGFLAPLANDLGDSYFLGDSLRTALGFYNEALSLYGGTGDLRTQVELGYKKAQCLLGIGRYDEARDEVTRAMDQLKKSGDTESDLAGLGHATLAFIEFTQGRTQGEIRMLLRAEEEIGKAVRIFSARIAATLTRSDQETQSLRNVNAFRLSVDIAAALYEATADPRYLESAFNTSEQSRAEAFVSDVGSRLVGKLQDPSVRELAAVAGKLLERSDREAFLAVDLTAPGGTRGIKAKPAADEQVSRDYERIVRQLAQQDNKASQLVSVNTLTLASVRGLLGNNDVMLNYYVSLDKIYLFVVSRNHQVLRTIAWKPEDLASHVEQYRASIHDLNSEAYLRHARTLYDSLLGPVAAGLAGKSLVIVPSARLNTLPFSGLHDGERFLVETNPIIVLPNASTLQFVQAGKKLGSAPSVLAVGNPENPRVTRLPGSEQEVKAVQSLYQRSLAYIGPEASEANSRRQMGGFDIVHFACHGIFNYDYPYLSSLALSPGGGHDGFLEVHEIYNLNLTQTSLVILSACETGLAKIRKNDDVIGLVRGFFYAGVPSLAASLWKVDDFATATLMSHFHALLKRGESKSAALQKAQQQLLHSQSTRHPYYWAAFVLYGSGG